MLINRTEKAEIQTYRKNSQTVPFEAESTGKTEKKPLRHLKKGSQTVHFDGARTAARIASKYHIRNATAKEIAEMSGELFNEGIISLDEHQALSYNREFHFDYYDFSEKYPEMDLGETPKRDFVQIWKDTLSSEKENHNFRKAETAEKIVNILENLELAAPVN